MYLSLKTSYKAKQVSGIICPNVWAAILVENFKSS